MNFNIEVRKKQLESLDQYITSSKDRVDSILDYLGWSAKKVLENEYKVTCPLNNGHTIPPDKIEKHVESCHITSSGYSLNDELLPEPMHNPPFSIILGNRQKIDIFNEAKTRNSKFKAAWNGFESAILTSDRIFSTFSSDERLALYDYCVKNTEAPPTPTEFDINVNGTDKKTDLPLTQKEELLRERNAKRRRIKYKSVHASHNKTYTEVIREVIANQMDIYQDYMKSKINRTEETKNNYLCYEQYEQIQVPEPEVVKNTFNQGKSDEPTSSTRRYSGVHSEKSYNAKECADSDARYENKSGRTKKLNESRKYREFHKKPEFGYERYLSKDSRREREQKKSNKSSTSNVYHRRSHDRQYRSERRH